MLCISSVAWVLAHIVPRVCVGTICIYLLRLCFILWLAFWVEWPMHHSTTPTRTYSANWSSPEMIGLSSHPFFWPLLVCSLAFAKECWRLQSGAGHSRSLSYASKCYINSSAGHPHPLQFDSCLLLTKSPIQFEGVKKSIFAQLCWLIGIMMRT